MLSQLTSKKIPSWRQVRYIGSVLSLGERRIALALIAIILIATGVIGVRVWQLHLIPVPAKGGEYIEGLVGTPNFINPLFAGPNDVDLDLTHLVYSGLMRVNPEGVLVPDLAETIEVSEDGKTITVMLREDAHFHDGSPVTTEDILFTYDAIQNSAYKSAQASSFRGVNVEASDDRTLTLTLSEVYSPFLSALTVGILPAHLWLDIPPQTANLAEFNVKPIGSGPYKFKAFSRDRDGTIRSYTLERFDDYYGQPPFISRLAFRFYPDFNSALEAYRARQIDGLGFAPNAMHERLRARPDVQEHFLALPQYTAVFFNPKQNAILKEVTVREALIISIDRERILRDALNNAGELVEGPVLLDRIAATTTLPRAAYDLDRARTLLAEDGWELIDGDQFRVKFTKDKKGKITATSTLAITLTTVDREENVIAAQVIEDAWRQIGVNVTTNIVPAAQFGREVLKTHKYDALLYGQILGHDPDPFPFWHSSQTEEGGFNLAQYANRNADSLLEAARKESDAETRASLYTQFSELVVSEHVAAFLYRPVYSYFVTTQVKGVAIDQVTIPADRFAGITDWYIKTKRRWR